MTAPVSLATLRKSVHKIVHLPEPAQRTLAAYVQLKVGNTKAACPYHINSGLRSTDRALLGKGSPREIVAAATQCFKKYDMQLDGDPERLRSFLTACGIGVDCSGFTSWVLNGVTQARLGRPVWKCVKFSGFRRRAISTLRPVQNMSARMLTSTLNAQPLTDLSLVRPGDMLRAANGRHVLIVTEAGLTKRGVATYFCYAQSSCMYGSASGVREGYAVIKNPHAPLVAQQWFDAHPRNIIEALLQEGGDDSRLVRLRALL